jgi:hypothetical protein
MEFIFAKGHMPQELRPAKIKTVEARMLFCKSNPTGGVINITKIADIFSSSSSRSLVQRLY